MTETEQLDCLALYDRSFVDQLAEATGSKRLEAIGISTLQINVGRLCNQACHHCHVDASPRRTEIMGPEIVARCIDLIENLDEIRTVDLTGGAPEMNPHFRELVTASVRAGKHVIDRCNLTIAEEPGYEWLLDFLAEHRVEVVSSLPHYSAARTDGQRGRGVFEKSISVLKQLNARGYGSDLPLNLVYNPSGLFLSGSQSELERDFREHLSQNYGIVFNSLYCINNMQINRFLDALVRKNKFQQYMETLANAFNPATIEGLMCRNQISVSWDGYLFDCDFNQMLGMPAEIRHIADFDARAFRERRIATANHCYGCTAGAGSSCGGELAG